MAKASYADKINRLFGQGEWAAARRLLEAELKAEPANHWLITQLGVTHYEQRHYEKALNILRESERIVPDCPLTLWNLAGALDALGKPHDAMDLYRRLLQSSVSPHRDPCWESDEWTEALKADCIFRLGNCYANLRHPAAADSCYRQYVELLLNGVEGAYDIEETQRQIHKLHAASNGAAAQRNRLNVEQFLSRLPSAGKGTRSRRGAQSLTE